MNTDDRDLADVIEQHLPYDGPHTREKVLDAAHGLSALVRYMCNATQPPASTRTLGWAATVHQALGGVRGAVYGLDPLFRQLADAMERQAAQTPPYHAP